MRNPEEDDTQPISTQGAKPNSAPDETAPLPNQRAAVRSAAGRAARVTQPQKTEPPRRRSRWYWVGVVFPFILALFAVTAVSGMIGWDSGQTQRQAEAAAQVSIQLKEQYDLAVLDMAEGRLDLARQRLEYIFTQDPNYENAAELWVQISMDIAVSATPTRALPTVTPTPTLDPRPIEELFAKAEGHVLNEQWSEAIDTLLALRQSDPTYRFAEVDGMLYLALRNRGVHKVLNEGNLESGLFDFSLAENFGPLDFQAENYRVWARLYLQGNSFWLAYPELAAQYYGQVAAAAPGLKDGSGWSAFYRYWYSLVHIGDQSAAEEDWCQAAEDYETALNARADNAIQATVSYVEEQCIRISATDTPAPTATSPATPTASPTASGPTASVTNTVSGGETPTPTTTPSPPAGDTPTPTETATEIPATETPTETEAPPPSDTPEPSASDTPES